MLKGFSEVQTHGRFLGHWQQTTEDDYGTLVPLFSPFSFPFPPPPHTNTEKLRKMVFVLIFLNARYA